MSKEYIVLYVKESTDSNEIDGQPAKVFMRFTEEPPSDFLYRLAKDAPGYRVYCLLGAATWHAATPKEPN